METCIVLSARRYSFKDDSSRTVEGCKITYLTGDVEQDENLIGMQTMSITAPLDIWPDMSRLPAYYGLDFKHRPGRDGKPTLTLVKAKWQADLPLEVDHVS